MSPDQERNKALVEKARRAQARLLSERKKMPKGVKAGMVINDPREDLMRRYTPQCVGPNNTHTSFFDEPGEHNALMHKHIAEGYEPVMDEFGEFVRDGADIMFTRPKELQEQHIARAEAIDEQRMASAQGLDMLDHDGAIQKAIRKDGLGGVTENETIVSEGPLGEFPEGATQP